MQFFFFFLSVFIKFILSLSLFSHAMGFPGFYNKCVKKHTKTGVCTGIQQVSVKITPINFSDIHSGSLQVISEGNRNPEISFPWLDVPRSLPWAGALQRARKPIIPTSGGRTYRHYLGSHYDADSVSLGLVWVRS